MGYQEYLKRERHFEEIKAGERKKWEREEKERQENAVAMVLFLSFLGILFSAFQALVLDRPRTAFIFTLTFFFAIFIFTPNSDWYYVVCLLSVPSALVSIYGAIARPKKKAAYLIFAALYAGAGLPIGALLLPNSLSACADSVARSISERKNILGCTVDPNRSIASEMKGR